MRRLQMNNKTIDLNTETDLTILKSMAYDRIAIINNAQAELNAIQNRMKQVTESQPLQSPDPVEQQEA